MDPTVLAWVLTAGPASVTPVDQASGTFIGYITSLGLAGIGLVVLFALYVWPGRLTKRVRDEARADLLEENARLREINARVIEQRDEALTVLRDQVGPLLTQFNASVNTMLPVLQAVVLHQERDRRDRG